MRGEFLSTRALVLAVLGDADGSAAAQEQAAEMTAGVEARAYAACAKAITLQAGNESATRVADALMVVDELAVWDAFVSAVRAWPPLLGVAMATELRTAAIATLRNSNDYDLARQVGVDIGRRPPRPRVTSTLSPREAEIVELVSQGMTDKEVAKALFISEATVRTHMRNVRSKTGSRSRAEVVAVLRSED
jgi:DNA-binding CsgD family transcriptional regulator